MADDARDSTSALDARRQALSARTGAASDSDQSLAAALVDAHSATLAALRRLDRIEAEVEAIVDGQAELPLDSPAGAREVQRYLVAKQREIADVVSETAADAAAKAAAVTELLGRYAAESDSSTD